MNSASPLRCPQSISRTLLSIALNAVALTGLAQTSESPRTAKWDLWYTYSAHGEPYYYYNDKVTIKSGRVHFENHLWKKEEGFINEEHLGAFAADTPELSPLFFNFRSTYRTTETIIDGNVDANSLSVKARKIVAGKAQDLPSVKRNLPPRIIFSVHFPVWLGKQLATLKQGVPRAFSTILEDNLTLGFSSVNGSVRLEKPDARAVQTHTLKIHVEYRGIPSSWWVEKNGAPVRVEYSKDQGLVERVSAERAKKFLD